MDENKDIKIEELFSYGMSKEGFKKLLDDIKNAVKEAKKSISCDKLSIDEEDKSKLYDVVSNATYSIDNSMDDIEKLFKRIITDWDNEIGDLND